MNDRDWIKLTLYPAWRYRLSTLAGGIAHHALAGKVWWYPKNNGRKF